MNYSISLANNIRTLQPELAERTVIESAEPLTPREIATRVGIHPLPDDLVETFMGGRGFVAKTLFDELPEKTDPLSPENLFIAATGPLTGHFLPSSGKTHFGCKSPATGGYGDSNMGGHFGPALKYAGYDMMIITGKAPPAEPSGHRQ